MLDLRGSVRYTENNGDRFLNIHGDEFEVKYSSWTGTAAVTLIANMALQNKAVLRPYVQVYVRQEWDLDHKLAFTQSGSGAFTPTAFEQDHLYAGLDAGLTYAVQNVTIGGAVYYEESSDEKTFGGRAGVTWKLNWPAVSRVLTVMVRASSSGKHQSYFVSGNDIYEITAPIIGEAVERIVEHKVRARGVIAAGEAFDGDSFLAALIPPGLRLTRTP